MYIKEEKCLKLFSKIVKHLGLWQKVRKKLKFQHLNMKLSWQPGLICAVGFITHICQIVLGPLGDVGLIPKNTGTLKSLNSQF